MGIASSRIVSLCLFRLFLVCCVLFTPLLRFLVPGDHRKYAVLYNYSQRVIAYNLPLQSK